MRTLPEIVAELKNLLSELEAHTGLPAKSNDDFNSIDLSDGDTITLSGIFTDPYPAACMSDSISYSDIITDGITIDLTSGKAVKN